MSSASVTDWLVFLVDALAAYRITRLIVADGFPPVKRLREWLLRRWPADDTRYWPSEVEWDTDNEQHHLVASGRQVVAYVDETDGELFVPLDGHWFGDLITCYLCAGTYVAVGAVVARIHWGWWPNIALVAAVGAVIGLLGDRS